MAEADFEIDFYGDDANEQNREQENYDDHQENGNGYHEEDHGHDNERASESRHTGGRHGNEGEGQQPTQQGVKRKSEELGDRPVDNGATSAIMISELNWWITDDDIRGWLAKAGCEEEVKELTFSEHKVNGKSKGQAYIEFETRQAATAAKRYVDQLSADSNQPGQKKTTTSYWNPGINPFRTLPKDAPMRAKEQPRTVQSGGSYSDRGGYGGGFRGRGGGMNSNRGGGMNPNFNRNFNNNMGGFNNMGGGFNNPMGGGGGNFGFNRGGGMMGGGMGGMRGNPGGMRGRGGGMMGMNPMGGMNMGMPGNMGMGMMGAGMPGFQGMGGPNFGGNFGFGQNQGGGNSGGGDWGNPHGAKRPRPE